MILRTHARRPIVGQVEAEASEATRQLVEVFATTAQYVAKVEGSSVAAKDFHINEAATDVVMGVTDEERHVATSEAIEVLPASIVNITVAEFEESHLVAIEMMVENAPLTESPTQIG